MLTETTPFLDTFALVVSCVAAGFWAGSPWWQRNVDKRLAERVNVTLESRLDDARESIKLKTECIAECDAHLEDLALAYEAGDEARIGACHLRIHATLNDALKTGGGVLVVPVDSLCEAHDLLHAPEDITARANSMEAQYRLSKALGGAPSAGFGG